ncbi:reversion-inducing cysteine-rich protein with Kazal motifs [Molossus molossus]|uniref:Reversion-inducing cysteine-rich protein with Kazal motifs n=2 Tax=Laurasiatheria TaxID=314145 RepID=A0A7J8EFR3_MOLMO|nr:reversion-inducing cysteine-rich protein with Kazal motifs [Molossus molossus]KAF6434347.1 reversion inducing cysteine rich protein with kazal motifs [Molossus molossus]
MATVRTSPRVALLLLLAVAGVAEVAGGLPPGSAGALCCDHSKDNQMCRDVCEQIFSSKSESRLKHLLQRAPDYCPETMVEIWSCMNSSLPGVFKKSDGWVGLGCCELAITLECRQACKQASSKNDISKVCRKEYENALFSCISRNEMGSVCCSYAGHHTNCREYCQAIFRTDSSPGPSQIKAVENYCAAISPQLIHCVNNYTQSYPMRNPTDSLYCCDRAEDHACQNACKRILMSKKTEMEIVDGLIEGCKTQPLPQDPLWQCFLESSQSVHPGVTLHPPPSTGLDGAKLHCCSKANTSTCRELCTKLYSMSWGNTQSWQEFDRFCEYNPVEVSMLTCLADVREPCQLGCRNLTYCTNFNNRPTELFRSCNAQSDQGAMNDMKLWEKGSIKMPFINIPVLDIKKCQPEMWKAIACSLQIKPCHSKSRGSIICKSDCVEILKKCGDQNKFPEDHTAESICELLSPTDDLESCIPLDTYLRPSTLGNIIEEVTHPCNPNPCPANELCEVNRKGCPSGDPCLPYSCVQGCKLGEASDFIVRQGTLIQVPSSAGSEVGCYKICSCGHSGLLENCMEMHCIDLQKSCIVGGKRKSHGTSFNIDCNVCSCFAGNLVCSTRLCLSEHSSEDDHRTFTGLPCNCADQFVPVCGQNGRTYPSACIARCVGLQDHQFEFGSCISKDPCNPNPCPKNQRCIPKPQVCLTTFDKFGCSQYECLPRQLTCDQVRDPVCDTNHMEHSNLCTLYQRGKSLLYKGPCQSFCRAMEPVCGHNGETYSSVCAAYSDRVAVDYYGPCQAVGVLSEHSSVTECAAVKCPALSAAECKPIIPPGACCPLCAGMLRVLFDKERLDTIAKVTNKKPVTVLDILQKIRMHVSVPQCDVFGYFSIESEIVILIIPVDHYPKVLQIEACNREAEKIESLINSDSPTLASHVPLSALIISQVQVSSSVPSTGIWARPPWPSCLLLSLGLTLHAVWTHN